MFLDLYETKGNKPLTALKGLDAASFPPCQNVLREKIKRTKFVYLMWSNLDSAHPPTLLPENYGWVLSEGSYKIKWHTGKMVPENLEDIVLTSESQSSEDEEYLVSSSDEDDGD